MYESKTYECQYKLPFIKFRTAPATVKLAFPTPIYIKGLYLKVTLRALNLSYLNNHFRCL